MELKIESQLIAEPEIDNPIHCYIFVEMKNAKPNKEDSMLVLRMCLPPFGLEFEIDGIIYYFIFSLILK